MKLDDYDQTSRIITAFAVAIFALTIIALIGAAASAIYLLLHPEVIGSFFGAVAHYAE